MTPRVRIMRSFLTSPRGLHQFEYQIVCYAIDNAPHTSSFSLENVINKLGKNTNHLFQWFRNNESKENTKYHLLVTGDCDKAQT